MCTILYRDKSIHSAEIWQQVAIALKKSLCKTHRLDDSDSASWKFYRTSRFEYGFLPDKEEIIVDVKKVTVYKSVRDFQLQNKVRKTFKKVLNIESPMSKESDDEIEFYYR